MVPIETAGGVCAGSYGAVSGMKVSDSQCIVNENYQVWKGLCSKETEAQLMEDRCYSQLQSLDVNIKNTILYTVLSMCKHEVYQEVQKCPQIMGEFLPDSSTSPELSIDGTFTIEQCHHSTQVTGEASFTLNIRNNKGRDTGDSPHTGN